MPYHAPAEEQLDRDGIAALQRRKLGALLEAVLASNAFYRAKLGGVKFDSARDAIESLPLTTKDELLADQAAHPPYGSNLTSPMGAYARLHQTSGSSGVPLRCPDRSADWGWWRHCWAMVYRAAGVTDEDRFIFPFSFGPFIGFWAAFESAVSLGNLCLPAGGMTTTARLQFLCDNSVTFVCCTPTYALRMAEVAREEGVDLAASSVRGLIVAGEPGGSIPATRQRIEEAWGARVFDHVGMSEVGAYAFECVEAPGGVHITESEFIAEVIDPASGKPVGDGESGELVLTNLGRVGFPVIRYRTGDCVRLARYQCACGRWFARMEGGVLGRIDDMFTVRGNNVYPTAIEAILRDFADVTEFRLVVSRRDAMDDLRIEIERHAGADSDELSRRVEAAIRDRLNFRPAVKVVEPGTLPRFEMKARRLVREDEAEK